MRLSKITWIILGVVVFGVVAGVLYMMYSRQLGEQETLQSSLSANQAKLIQISTERKNLEAQLAQVQDQLAQKKADLDAAVLSLNAAKSEWPGQAQSIEYDEKIFDLADGWNLAITTLQAGETGSQAFQGVTFSVNTFVVSVIPIPLTTGFENASAYEIYLYRSVGDILGFITSLANDDAFATASIQPVSLTFPELMTSEEALKAGTKAAQPTCTVTVAVYTFKGG